jgi:hypothetical protein
MILLFPLRVYPDTDILTNILQVVGFIPGVGKVVGKAMEGASEGLNKASDAIHAHIGGKLGQAMHRMDKAQKVVGYIP